MRWEAIQAHATQWHPTQRQTVEGMVEIEGYTDLDIIGRGGFAVVYKARQVSVGRDVAIKLLTDPAPDDDLVRRFTRESKAVGALSWHPHIAAVVDAGSTTTGQAYITFEFLTGGSLDEHIAAAPMPWTDAVEAMIQIADAVEAAHRSGVLHRDIKPANILLDRLGVAKLGDFGIASMHDGHKTETGVLAATVAHAAPELFDGQTAGRATDVYALGSTLHTLLTGTPPFMPRSAEMMTVISRILHEPPPLVDPTIAPTEVTTVVSHALAKQAAYRPRSAAAFGRALQQAQRTLGVSVTAMPISDTEADPATYNALDGLPQVVGGTAAETVHAEVVAGARRGAPAADDAPPAPQPPDASGRGTSEPPTQHVPFAPASDSAVPERSAVTAKPLSKTIIALALVAALLAGGLAYLLLSGGTEIIATTAGGARITSVDATDSTEMPAPNHERAAIDQNLETMWGIQNAPDAAVVGTTFVINLEEPQRVVSVGIENGTANPFGRVSEMAWTTSIACLRSPSSLECPTAGPVLLTAPDEPGRFPVGFGEVTDQIVLHVRGAHGDGATAGIAEILIEIEGTS